MFGWWDVIVRVRVCWCAFVLAIGTNYKLIRIDHVATEPGKPLELNECHCAK